MQSFLDLFCKFQNMLRHRFTCQYEIVTFMSWCAFSCDLWGFVKVSFPIPNGCIQPNYTWNRTRDSIRNIPGPKQLIKFSILQWVSTAHLFPCHQGKQCCKPDWYRNKGMHVGLKKESLRYWDNHKYFSTQVALRCNCYGVESYSLGIVIWYGKYFCRNSKVTLLFIVNEISHWVSPNSLS